MFIIKTTGEKGNKKKKIGISRSTIVVKKEGVLHHHRQKKENLHVVIYRNKTRETET